MNFWREYIEVQAFSVTHYLVILLLFVGIQEKEWFIIFLSVLFHLWWSIAETAYVKQVAEDRLNNFIK